MERNLISDLRNYNNKNTFFQLQNKNLLNKNYNNGNKKWTKNTSMSEGNTCIVEPNLDVLPLRYFDKGLV